MEFSILRKVPIKSNNMGELETQSFKKTTVENKEENQYVPPLGTSTSDWFKWYSGEYLKSEHWQKTRDRIVKRDENRCRFCGCSGTHSNPLQVHHRDYDSLWKETDATLITLCKICHTGLHRIKK